MVDEVIKLQLIEKFASGSSAEWFPHYPFTTADLVYPIINSSGVRIRITNKTVTAYTLVIEYTKISD